jgi:hypothetical protein
MTAKLTDEQRKIRDEARRIRARQRKRLHDANMTPEQKAREAAQQREHRRTNPPPSKQRHLWTPEQKEHERKRDRESFERRRAQDPDYKTWRSLTAEQKKRKIAMTEARKRRVIEDAKLNNPKLYAEMIEKQRARLRRIEYAKHGIKNADRHYREAVKAVPRTLPREVRDDIIADLMLSLIEGKVRPRDITKRAPEFISKYWKSFGHAGTLSLDARMGEGGATYLDMLADETEPYCEDDDA